MSRLMQRLAAALVLGRKARADVFRMIADLLEAGFPLERALEIAARTAKEQGQGGRARLLRSWRRALLEDRFADAVAGALPASEAMIFHAYGRVDAGVLFAAAARVAEMRDRQLNAVWKALAMPMVLAVGLVLLLWAAGGHFIPVIETVSPPEEWSAGARLFRSVSLWLHGNTLVVRGGPRRSRGARGYRDGGLDRAGAGPARQDRPLLALPHAHRLGLPVRGHGVPGRRHRRERPRLRGAEARRLPLRPPPHRGDPGAHGERLGPRPQHGPCGPRLPGPLAGAGGGGARRGAGWERKLARFVERWVGRSEALLRARAAALNGALLIVAAVVMGSGIDAMFSILEQAAGPGNTLNR